MAVGEAPLQADSISVVIALLSASSQSHPISKSMDLPSCSNLAQSINSVHGGRISQASPPVKSHSRPEALLVSTLNDLVSSSVELPLKYSIIFQGQQRSSAAVLASPHTPKVWIEEDRHPLKLYYPLQGIPAVFIFKSGILDLVKVLPLHLFDYLSLSFIALSLWNLHRSMIILQSRCVDLEVSIFAFVHYIVLRQFYPLCRYVGHYYVRCMSRHNDVIASVPFAYGMFESNACASVSGAGAISGGCKNRQHEGSVSASMLTAGVMSEMYLSKQHDGYVSVSATCVYVKSVPCASASVTYASAISGWSRFDYSVICAGDMSLLHYIAHQHPFVAGKPVEFKQVSVYGSPLSCFSVVPAPVLVSNRFVSLEHHLADKNSYAKDSVAPHSSIKELCKNDKFQSSCADEVTGRIHSTPLRNEQIHKSPNYSVIMFVIPMQHSDNSGQSLAISQLPKCLSEAPFQVVQPKSGFAASSEALEATHQLTRDSVEPPFQAPRSRADNVDSEELASTTAAWKQDGSRITLQQIRAISPASILAAVLLQTSRKAVNEYSLSAAAVLKTQGSLKKFTCLKCCDEIEKRKADHTKIETQKAKTLQKIYRSTKGNRLREGYWCDPNVPTFTRKLPSQVKLELGILS